MPNNAYPQRPLALTFRRYLTTRPAEDLVAAATQQSAELAAKDVALAMARGGEPESAQPATAYERDASFRGDYSELVVSFPDHHSLGAFVAALGEAAWDAEVRWLPEADPPDVIQITRPDDGLPADLGAAREAMRGVCHYPLALVEIEALDGQADGQPEGRYATWLPEGFPDYQVAYMDSEDWEVEVVFRGHERRREKRVVNTGRESPIISLTDLDEEIVQRIKETMRSYVIAAQEQKGECWDEKERMEGGVDALYDLARRAGVLERVIGYEAALRQASIRLREETEWLMSEAPATIERLEAEGRRGRRDFASEEFGSYAAAQEALTYGPYILRYLDGEDVEGIA